MMRRVKSFFANKFNKKGFEIMKNSGPILLLIIATFFIGSQIVNASNGGNVGGNVDADSLKANLMKLESVKSAVRTEIAKNRAKGCRHIKVYEMQIYRMVPRSKGYAPDINFVAGISIRVDCGGPDTLSDFSEWYAEDRAETEDYDPARDGHGYVVELFFRGIAYESTGAIPVIKETVRECLSPACK
jgi:hypothetical protein